MARPAPSYDVLAAARAFALTAAPESFTRWGSGHINDTFAVTLRGGARVVLQRINTDVFRDPEGVMTNVARVTRHLRRKLVGTPDAGRRALTLVPARGGADFVRDDGGRCFRAYEFIDGARSVDVLESPRQAYEAAKAFGTFQRLLADLPGPRLVETIPSFHDTRKRFEALEEAVTRDARSRAAGAAPEIGFARSREPLADSLLLPLAAGELVERAAHNDTKLNNVLFDEATGEALCVVDLDTVMPGLFLYDFGDMVRAAVSPSAEDERDLSKVEASEDVFEALVRGTVEVLGDTLARADRERLVLAGKVITFEIGIRFLADHLDGDVYFRVRREGHNLDRARTQFALVRSLEEKEERLTRIVEKAVRSGSG
jgi:Ser/Thr protein kinase RdoA (MazF antagonist)